MLTSSGQAANLLAILNVCSAGDSFISVSSIYGGTVNLFGVTLKRFGIECIWVEDGRTYAIYEDGVRYRLRGRLYEVEAKLGSEFVRINKSALANWNRIRRFKASIAGAVDVEFKSGHVEYVSRRCFAELKRRFDL